MGTGGASDTSTSSTSKRVGSSGHASITANAADALVRGFLGLTSDRSRMWSRLGCRCPATRQNPSAPRHTWRVLEHVDCLAN